MTIRTYSNRLLSSFQSAIRMALSETGESTENLCADHPMMQATCAACDEMVGDADHVHAVAEPVTKTELVSECARLYVGLLRAEMMGDLSKVAEIEDKIRFSVCDPLWAKALLEHRKHSESAVPYKQYKNLDDFVQPLPEKQSLTVALVADWGTGTPTARNVMRCIGTHNPDLLIHLGDVYYSGTQREMDEHFLQIVREELPAETSIYTLAGNHDLYAGGVGYYWLLEQIGQPASYFCLRNDHWQIQAIGVPPEKGSPDAALSSVPLIDEAEIAWHKDKLATANGRRTVMLSHYQLFTASGNIGRNAQNKPLAINPALYAAFKDDLPNIDLWLWGHEHNMIGFDPYLGLQRGRCIGSGAIPVPLLWEPYKTLPDLVLPNGVSQPPHIQHDLRLGHDGDHYHHGYCVLTLDGEQGKVDYYEVANQKQDSKLIYSEVITN